MEYTIEEKGILDLMGRTDFRNLSKGDVISYASKLAELRPEVARDVLAQYPQFVDLMKTALSEYRQEIDKIIENDDASIEHYYTYTEKDQAESSKAFECFKIGARIGYPDSINMVGLYYEEGKGTEKNGSKAIEYYKRAAELGLAVAQSNLATCYKEGTGCEQNLEKAKEWAMKAAKQGQENAIKNLKEWFGMEIDN